MQKLRIPFHCWRNEGRQSAVEMPLEIATAASLLQLTPVFRSMVPLPPTTLSLKTCEELQF